MREYPKLKIDEGFKNLITPLSPDEYRQLEQNLITDGCREPISTWNGYILDGHNRYEICTRMNIPFQTRRIKLHSHEAAVAWICANQLGRRNISEATRKYLIGKRYEAEKTIGTPNAVGSNQYARKVDVPKKWVHPLSDRTILNTARRLGSEYHISHSTVNKYANYAHALDILAKKEPEIVPKILSGEVKMSYENVVELSVLPNKDIKRLSQQLSNDTVGFPGYSKIRREIRESALRTTKPKAPAIQLPSVSIKNMPVYDPDAEISSLTLTIPSWVSSINHARSTSDLRTVSSSALNKLEKQLVDLTEVIKDILTFIKEENHNG